MNQNSLSGHGSQWVTIAAGTFSPSDGVGGATTSTANSAAHAALLSAITYGREVVVYGMNITTVGTGNLTVTVGYSDGSQVVDTNVTGITIGHSVATVGWWPFGGPEGVRFPARHTTGAPFSIRFTAPTSTVGSLVYKIVG